MWTISKTTSGEVKVIGGSGIHTFQRKDFSTLDDRIRFLNAIGEPVYIPYKQIQAIDGVAAADNLSDVIDQILALFETSVGNGGGSAFDGQLKQNAAPVSVSNPLPVQSVTSGTPYGMSVTTSATGATPVAFTSQACKELEIVNDSNTVDIEYQVNATGSYVRIPARSWKLIDGITNANQVRIRRADQANTQITITAEARI